MKEDRLLWDRLTDYAGRGILPMHMPGHKRNMERYPWLAPLGGAWDITEIDGFDDVVEIGRYAGVTSFLCVNGSTGALLAAVRTAVAPGQGLLMARNCHKAVYHAAELCGARVTYLQPDWDGAFGICGRMCPDTAGAALAACAETPAAVVITSPTFEGDVSDIPAIAALCHARGVPLIVDEAHGAHFGLAGFPETAIRLGADIVVQSLHKTLPSPTQTAIVHIRSGLLSAAELRRQLLVFQTSSPSFLLMAAAEKAVAYVKEEGEAQAAAWLQRLAKLRTEAAAWKNLRLRANDDPSKLLVASELPGKVWMARLRSEYGIEAEMAEQNAVLFMTGMGDTDRGLERLAAALKAEDAVQSGPAAATFTLPAIPEQVLPAWKAVRMEKEALPALQAVGKISADYHWLYPPGIPYLVPGERIDADAAEKAVANGEEALYTLR